LKEAGFIHISEREQWELENGGKYFFTRNHSTIVAFAIGKKFVNPFRSDNVFIFTELRKLSFSALAPNITKSPNVFHFAYLFYCQ
jgi:Aminopeptidase I zinc metalloprotease (M18)